MRKNKINIGIIGLGYLGKYHYEKYHKNPLCNIEWVVDINKKNLNYVSPQYKKTTNYKEIIKDVDAVSIVTPTKNHFPISKYFLEKNIHVLLEKPMTDTIEQANKLIKIAKTNKLILQIGHLERFNPVMNTLNRQIKNPMFIEGHRLSKFNVRSTDVNVIYDLMIHDIDIIKSLVNSNIKKISAFGKKILTKSTDIANVRIEFSNKCIANLTASRISQKNERKLRIFQKDTYLSVDFMNHEIKKYTKDKIKLFKREDFKFDKSDALKIEINNFILSCLGKEKPLVNGEMGKEALLIAHKISKLL